MVTLIAFFAWSIYVKRKGNKLLKKAEKDFLAITLATIIKEDIDVSFKFKESFIKNHIKKYGFYNIEPSYMDIVIYNYSSDIKVGGLVTATCRYPHMKKDILNDSMFYFSCKIELSEEDIKEYKKEMRRNKIKKLKNINN